MRQLPGNGGGSFLQRIRDIAAMVATFAVLIVLIVLLWPVLTVLAVIMLALLLVGLVTLLVFGWRVRREFRRQMGEWQRQHREASGEQDADEEPQPHRPHRPGHRAKHVNSRVREDE